MSSADFVKRVLGGKDLQRITFDGVRPTGVDFSYDLIVVSRTWSLAKRRCSRKFRAQVGDMLGDVKIHQGIFPLYIDNLS